MAAFPALENPVYIFGVPPFEYQFEGYTEQGNIRAENAFIRARVAWEDRDDFKTAVAGFTQGFAGDTTLNRVLPLQHPENPNLWCTDWRLIECPSSSLENANQFGFGQDPTFFDGGGMFAADWAVYGLTFSRMPYFVVDNDVVVDYSSSHTDVILETLRYCLIASRPRAREFTVKSFGLAEQGNLTNVLPIPAFVMDREMDLMITILQFPAESYPFTAITASIGNTNDAAIDLPISFTVPNTWKTNTYPIDTLLFRGVATDITPYPGPDGRWYIDIPYFFTYRPSGWRKLPDPSGTGAPITVVYLNISPDKYLYNQVPFKNLFQPNPT